MSEYTPIAAKCDDCGEVRIFAKDVTVRICVDNGAGSYAFQCPECEGAVARNASPLIVDTLQRAGCRTQDWRKPLELSEPHFAGDRLTNDYEIDFHFDLAKTDFVSIVAHRERGKLRQVPVNPISPELAEERPDYGGMDESTVELAVRMMEFDGIFRNMRDALEKYVNAEPGQPQQREGAMLNQKIAWARRLVRSARPAGLESNGLERGLTE